MTLHRKEQIFNITSQLLEQIAQFGLHLYGISHQSQAGFVHFVEQIACLSYFFFRIIITPLYMCTTQATLNRLKQPKNFYSVDSRGGGSECKIGSLLHSQNVSI